MAVQHQWDYLTFEEAAGVLGIAKNELMRHVAANNIIPCKFFDGRYQRFSIEGTGPDGLPIFLDYEILYMQGLFYLHGHSQTSPVSCEWKWFSESRSSDSGESLYDTCTQLKSNDLMEELVFQHEEIDYFAKKLVPMVETRQTKAGDDYVPERRINNMRRVIIGAMVCGYSYNPSAKRNDAIGDLHKDLLRLGIELSTQTILDIVRDAAQVLPQKKDG